MGTPRLSRVWLRAACAALAVLAASCWDEEYDPGPEPPGPQTWVSIDDYDTRVDAASAWLNGEVECPDCFASDWQYGTCPVIECPSTEGSWVRWSNRTTGERVPHYYFVTALATDAESFDSPRASATPE